MALAVIQPDQQQVQAQAHPQPDPAQPQHEQRPSILRNRQVSFAVGTSPTAPLPNAIQAVPTPVSNAGQANPTPAPNTVQTIPTVIEQAVQQVSASQQATADGGDVVTSTTHRREYMQFLRAAKNPTQT